MTKGNNTAQVASHDIGGIIAAIVIGLLLAGLSLSCFAATAWVRTLGLGLFVLLFIASIVFTATTVPKARGIGGRMNAIRAVLALGVTVILFFALVFWIVYRTDPSQYAYSQVVVEEEMATAPPMPANFSRKMLHSSWRCSPSRANRTSPMASASFVK